MCVFHDTFYFGGCTDGVSGLTDRCLSKQQASTNQVLPFRGQIHLTPLLEPFLGGSNLQQLCRQSDKPAGLVLFLTLTGRGVNRWDFNGNITGQKVCALTKVTV